MAVGDIFNIIPTSVENNATLDIRPSSGQEAVIHNIYYSNSVEFYITNGTNSIKFDSDSTLGARLCMCFHVTNTIYIQIKNVSGSVIYVSYDGVVT